ncbi:hypothetical protein VE00_02219 [Pseudogymnoascus sp. WSF 3629]|nr:hypothetical protein VE00_02219 [Pseudogymnoascus sp. WSF 3629]
MSLTEFAQAVLWVSIAVTMLLLLCLLIKARELRKLPLTNTRFHLLHQLKINKQIIGLMVAVILIVSLAWLSQPAHIKGPYLTSVFLSALAAICLNLLLHLEQRIYPPTGSDIVTVYLIEPTPWDASLLPVLVRCVGNTLIFTLECCSGGITSTEAAANHISTKKVKGILSRTFFIWINQIIAQGYRHILTKDRIPYLRQNLKPRHISTAAYQHRLNRLKLSTKSALIGLVHNKMMTLPSTMDVDGEAVTLMSTDAEGLEGITEMFHET